MIVDVKENIIRKHFQDLQAKYPAMKLSQNVFGNWVVRGELCASAIFENVEIKIEDVKIELILSSMYPETPPVVRETTGLTKEFHTNTDGTLCLGSPLAVRATYMRHPTLVGFVEGSVIPFFFAFNYLANYGELPFGELSHGGKGLLEYYQELFDISSGEHVLGLLRILAESDYRGHLPCPCGSHAALRQCHGEILREISTLQSTDDFFMDYYSIFKLLSELNVTISQEFLIKRRIVKKHKK